MEMRDPASVNLPTEEQTTPAAPAAESVAENENLVEQTVEAPSMDEDADDAAVITPLTREALLDAARAVYEKEASEITPDDIRHLRQQYNAFRKVEQASEEVPAENVVEAEDDEIKTLLANIRDKKAEYTAQVEAQRLANLERKQAIIEEIIALADDTDNVNRTFPRYRELQDEFNSIGEVPATEDTAIWKHFQEARERYSDNLKINKELRDYDFRKNLDSKQLLL